MKKLDFAQMEGLIGSQSNNGYGSWRACFEGGAGKTPMIIGAAIASEIPGGIYAFYLGGALACL